MRTCSVISIANSGAPFDSTCSARTSSPDDIRYQRIIRFTKFRDATRAAAFPGCPRNLVLSSGPIAARTSRRSFIFAPQPTVTLSRPCREKAKKHRRGWEVEWGAPRKRNAPSGHLTGRVPLSLGFPDGTQPRPSATSCTPRQATPAASRSPRTFVPPIPPADTIAWGVGGADWAVGSTPTGAEGAEDAGSASRGPPGRPVLWPLKKSR